MTEGQDSGSHKSPGRDDGDNTIVAADPPMRRQTPSKETLTLTGWLNVHHVTIRTICTVIQTVVITAGVVIALHQLGMLRRSAERSAVRATYNLWAGAGELMNTLDSFVNRHDKVPISDWTGYLEVHRTAQRVFGELELCVTSGDCDFELARRLFCPAAVKIAAVAGLPHELVITVGTEELAVYHFAAKCFPECAQHSAYIHWLDDYKKLFPRSAVVRSGALDRGGEVRADFVCTFVD